jgi:hypothetical protein
MRNVGQRTIIHDRLCPHDWLLGKVGHPHKKRVLRVGLLYEIRERASELDVWTPLAIDSIKSSAQLLALLILKFDYNFIQQSYLHKQHQTTTRKRTPTKYTQKHQQTDTHTYLQSPIHFNHVFSRLSPLSLDSPILLSIFLLSLLCL